MSPHGSSENVAFGTHAGSSIFVLRSIKSAGQASTMVHGPCAPTVCATRSTAQIESNDGWGRPLWVIIGDYAMVFVSLGADGKIGTKDDISGGLKWERGRWVLSGCAEGGG